MPDPTDNCVVNFFPLGESFYACTETKYLRKVDPKTLETLEKVTMKGGGVGGRWASRITMFGTGWGGGLAGGLK